MTGIGTFVPVTARNIFRNCSFSTNDPPSVGAPKRDKSLIEELQEKVDNWLSRPEEPSLIEMLQEKVSKWLNPKIKHITDYAAHGLGSFASALDHQIALQQRVCEAQIAMAQQGLQSQSLGQLGVGLAGLLGRPK